MALFLDKGDMMSELERIETAEGFIKLGGKDRKMVFGMKAFRILQKEFGSLEKAMSALANMGVAGGLDLELLVTIVYAGVSIDKECTKEQVSDWLDEIPTMQDAIALVLTVADAIRLASPVASGDPTSPTEK
jgi:hypothetical protein